MLKHIALSALFAGTATIGFASTAHAEDPSDAIRRLWVGPEVEARSDAEPRIPVKRADAAPRFSIQAFWTGEPNYGETYESLRDRSEPSRGAGELDEPGTLALRLWGIASNNVVDASVNSYRPSLPGDGDVREAGGSTAVAK